MAICKVTVATDQCGAEQPCAPSWHLCTASEYRARGGGTSGPPDGGAYWLAGCVREGDTVFAPKDAPCAPPCTYLNGARLTETWDCVDGPGTTTTGIRSPLGIATHASCLRLGADVDGAAAYWITTRSDTPLSGVLCCL